jgi:hypothetical protein
MLFKFGCTCPPCRPDLYSPHPLSCKLQHQKSHLLIDEVGEPIVTDTPYPKFEALHLADVAIEFFSQVPARMSDRQAAALAAFRMYKNDLVGALSQDDCRSLAPHRMAAVIKHLDQMFFMGVLSPGVYFSWDARCVERATSAHFGFCRTHIARSGLYYHAIFLNPTMVSSSLGGSRAAARIGTLLHEMLHGFLFTLGCTECRTATENMGLPIEGHGRSWHRLAKALETAASDLLGIPGIDLGRFETLKRWYEDPIRGYHKRLKVQCNPSCHDLKEYGFV